MKNEKFRIGRQRRKARCLAMQALYQWQFSDTSEEELLLQFLRDVNAESVDVVYLKEMISGVIQNYKQIDDAIAPILDRPLQELNSVELAILRLATYELMFRLDVPRKVVINEALEITKKYGSADGHKYVNGVLDKLAAKLREKEI